ncbi:tRNA (adenine(37)-N6)-methyltransferase-like [Orbicella faveolata]|uniref:tRNA (adenine(37)-N6)-methyltransferase-like n=1 Tax=Orbicella faveolata TaxID=48498 RepID=UPI0009E4FC22|nr:tRNA (adenine(37)-N6)-methyltransferase-like [Orbicella faveolata]
MMPIGFVQSCFKEKNGIPRQPSVCPAAKAKLCVSVRGFTNPGHCLDGLENFSHVWIVFLFHKNTNKAVKAKVKPPRLDGTKVGVFASRSPHRPNPIGLTLAKLDGIVGNTLLLSAIDLLDGTPVLDIKPYVPDYDKPPNLVEDKLELESSGKTLSQNSDISRSQETAPVSPGSQLIDQSCTVPMQQILDLQSEPTTCALSIAEWIRKPPINELDVKFSDAAIEQIGCFHGKRHPLLKELHRKSVDLSVHRRTCLQKLKLGSETFAGEEPGSCELGNNQIVGNPWIKPCDAGTCRPVNTVADSYGSCSKTSLNEKTNESIDDANGSQDELSLKGKSAIVSEEVGGDLKESIPQPVTDSELLPPSDVCIYQLEMLSSPEEAKQAITDILRADPRSVYRRNCCQDKLYSFSIDTMNVTCNFEESTVEVLRVEPVFYRKLK